MPKESKKDRLQEVKEFFEDEELQSVNDLKEIELESLNDVTEEIDKVALLKVSPVGYLPDNWLVICTEDLYPGTEIKDLIDRKDPDIEILDQKVEELPYKNIPCKAMLWVNKVHIKSLNLDVYESQTHDGVSGGMGFICAENARSLHRVFKYLANLD